VWITAASSNCMAGCSCTGNTSTQTTTTYNYLYCNSVSMHVHLQGSLCMFRCFNMQLGVHSRRPPLHTLGARLAASRMRGTYCMVAVHALSSGSVME
jgi:hypothetical protein